MSLQSRLSALITQIGLAFKADRSRLDALEARLADRHVFSDAPVSISTSTALADKINQVANVDGGNYRITVSYLWNADSNASDFVSAFFIDSLAQHQSTYLHRLEPKDNAGDVLGTFSAQTMGFTKIWDGVPLAAGAHTVQLQWGSERNGVEASIWDAVITIERVSL